MTIERLKAIASDPKRTRKELEQMRLNASSQANFEAIRIIDEVLQSRFGTAVAPLDRDDPAVAASRIKEMFPRKLDRVAILDRLLRSTEVANAVAPSAWAVTLSKDYFRLNVGQVEVLVGYPGGFFFNCSASADSGIFKSLGFEPVHYASIPDPQCSFRGVPSDLKTLPIEVQRAHERFVDFAARAPSGKPRAGTSFRKSHSQGLVKYARELVGGRARGA